MRDFGTRVTGTFSPLVDLALIMSGTYQSTSGEFPVIPALADPAYTYLQLALGNNIQVPVVPL